MEDAGPTLRAKKAHVGNGSVEVLGYKVDRLNEILQNSSGVP